MTYRVIYADPPWSYDDSGVRGGTDHHYEQMSTAEIAAMGPKIRTLADPRGSCLLLWATCPLLDECLSVLRSWGYRYRGVAFVWVKSTRDGKAAIGGGRIATRANAELVLLGHRGVPPKRKSASISQILISPREDHSQKPLEIAGRINDLYGEVPRVELFARRLLYGWDGWGAELKDCMGTKIRATDPALKQLLG